MRDLLTIGAFSRACRLSVKTLRYYADQGLLVPAWVDPDTRYRYYRPIQSMEAERIRLYRELELPLAEIQELLRHPERTSDILGAHEARIQARIASQQRALAELRAHVHDLPQPYPVVARTQPAMEVLSVRLQADLAGLGARIGPILRGVMGLISRRGAGPVGPAFIRYHGDAFDPDDLDLELGVPTSKRLRGEGDIQAHSIPEMPVVATLHPGPYERIGRAYAALLGWMSEHGHHPAGPPLESYLTGPAQGGPPEGYRTEIIWPARP